jgi:hypothetical protein
VQANDHVFSITLLLLIIHVKNKYRFTGFSEKYPSFCQKNPEIPVDCVLKVSMHDQSVSAKTAQRLLHTYSDPQHSYLSLEQNMRETFALATGVAPRAVLNEVGYLLSFTI